MSLSNVLQNHGNVINYVKAVVAALEEFAEHDPPADMGFDVEEVRALKDEVNQMAKALDACARNLAPPGVVSTVLSKAYGELEATTSAPGHEAPDAQVYHLTTTKRAQA
jgi:hypothetical protein